MIILLLFATGSVYVGHRSLYIVFIVNVWGGTSKGGGGSNPNHSSHWTGW